MTNTAKETVIAQLTVKDIITTITLYVVDTSGAIDYLASDPTTDIVITSSGFDDLIILGEAYIFEV